MKTKILLVLLSVINTLVFGQEFNFNIHNTTISEYIKLEEKLGGNKVLNKSNHISFENTAQPISYIRKENIIPNMKALYFFNKKDSIMSYILYEWDIRNFEKTSNNPQTKSVQKALIKKYLDLENLITEKFGQSQVEGNLENFEMISTKEGLHKRNVWKSNDSTEIEMYSKFSNFYQKNGVVTRPTVHRIRLYIRNKRKKHNSNKLSKEKKQLLNTLSKDFLSTLTLQDFEKSRSFLSEESKLNVTVENLKSLKEYIDTEREVVLFSHSIQIGTNNSIFTTLEFRYTNDSSSPPTEIIKVIFNEKDKIVRVQPLNYTNKIKG